MNQRANSLKKKSFPSEGENINPKINNKKENDIMNNFGIHGIIRIKNQASIRDI